ncbi:hypothetical protein JXB01_02840 [Candidatus Micrarchaeota archaeon]|nr:hypothetical protein [Candidatus Micrarchaeota archaeon]
MNKKSSHEDVYRFGRNERKTRVIPLFIIIAILAVGALVYFNYFYQPEEVVDTFQNGQIVEIQEEVQEVEIVNTSSEQYKLGVAVSTNDPSICEQLTELKENCYVSLSLENVEACKKVETYEKKKECIEFWVESTNITSLCDNLKEEDRMECGLLVDPCYGKKSSERKLCLALEYNDYAYCIEDDCFYEYAKEKEDETVCDVFDVPAKQMACESLVKKDDECQYLVFSYQRDMCYDIYARKLGGDYFCTLINPDSIYSYSCFNEFAIRKQNMLLCEKLETLNYRWDCLSNYALEYNDITACERIDEFARFSREACILHIAQEYSNPSYCTVTQDISVRNGCYSNIILKPEGAILPENCNNVLEKSWKDKCYSVSANATKDITVCGYISDLAVKEICKKQFED